MLNQQLINLIKSTHPAGTKVRLIKMDDKQSPPVGTVGTVRCVDDIGSIHVTWENGSSLALVPGVDAYIILSTGSENQEASQTKTT